jgi:hypothetical protein
VSARKAPRRPKHLGRDGVKQVAEWLGHADPAFTLRTYVHLLDDGAGDADFFDRVSLPTAVAARWRENAATIPAA